MDSITQAVLGAAIGEQLLGEKIGNKGALLGAVIATIPDLDVVFYLFYSKLDMLSIHRGFSHSIVFSILGGFLLAFFLNRLKGLQTISFKILFLFTWLCLFTHSLLDTFTAYGTQLLLPFSDRRLGFDSINVVDPLYTVPLIVGLLFSLWLYSSSEHRVKFNNYGLLFSSLYLVFTLANKQRVEGAIATQLAQQNISYHSLLTMPVGIANINWYGVAKSQDSLYLLPFFPFSDKKQVIEAFPIHEEYLQEIDKELAYKMHWFAKGFYTVEKIEDKIRVYNLQVDMRGIVSFKNHKAPTAGYFEFSTKNNKTTFSSGTIGKD